MPFVRATQKDPEPAGVYKAVLERIEERDSPQGDGTYLFWAFKARNKKKEEIELTGTSSTRFGPSAKPRKWAQTLLGRTLTKDEALAGMDLDELVGASCQLVIGVTEKDAGVFNVIENVLPIDDEE
jgi:hypothetical protein